MKIYKKLLVPLFCFVFILMSSCSPDEPEKPSKPIEPVEYDINDLDPSLRLVLMMGHVAAGMELYRSGEYEMAAPHLLHPISETHKKEREGFQEMGLDVVTFVLVSTALEAKRPAVEIEPFLKKAEDNLKSLALKVEGNPETQIRFLLDQIKREYSIGVKGGEITDIGEFQDAFGFASTAKTIAEQSELTNKTSIIAAIDELIKCWPSGPNLVQNPLPVSTIDESISLIMNLL